MQQKYEKDPSGMSYCKISRRLGLRRNVVFVMRKQQPDRFNYIKSLDPFFERGYRKYLELQQDVVDELQGIYYELADEKHLHKFSAYLYELGIYGSKASWACAVEKTIFKHDIRSMSHNGLMKKMKVIEAYDNFEYEEK